MRIISKDGKEERAKTDRLERNVEEALINDTEFGELVKEGTADVVVRVAACKAYIVE